MDKNTDKKTDTNTEKKADTITEKNTDTNSNKNAEAVSSERSKKSKGKILSRVRGVVIIIAVFLGMNYVATLCFDDIRTADYYKYDANRLAKENANVDMIIVGASQAYHGCNPQVISEELDIGEVLITASPAAHNDGEYYMLRDALRKFTPKCVVIEMPWRKFMDKNGEEVSRGKLLIADRLEWPDKLDYAYHCFTSGEWLNLMVPIYRYGGSIWGRSQLVNNYRARKELNAGLKTERTIRNYQGNGFFWYRKSCPVGSIPAEDKHYSDDLVSDYEYYWISKMCELCKEKWVPVVFVTLPTSIEELYAIENYQASPEFMKKFANERGCEYLNFSLLKGREEFLQEPYYVDKMHLNGEGSLVFSPYFARGVERALSGEDTSDMFYKDIDELKSHVNRVVACNGRVYPAGDGTLTVEVKSLQNEDITPEYRLLLMREEDVLEKYNLAGFTDGGDDSGTGTGDDDESGAGENGEAGGAEAGEAGAGANGEAGAGEVVIGPGEKIEIRGWQEGTVFTLDESEIPAGCALRLEARSKGVEGCEAYLEGLQSDFVLA